MGQLQQAGRAGKALERKICPQAVADHRNVQIHRYHEQLLGLLRSEKLALVAQHAGQRRTVSVGRAHGLEHVRLRRDQQISLAAHAQTAHQLTAALGVHLWLEDQHPHPLFFVVVGYLHQGGAFAAVHRAVTEIQFCHLKNSPYRKNPLSQSLTALPAPPMGELFCIFRAGCPSPEKQKLSRPHS